MVGSGRRLREGECLGGGVLGGDVLLGGEALLGGLLGLVGEGEKGALTKETSLVLVGAGVGVGERVMTGYLGGVMVMTGMGEG